MRNLLHVLPVQFRILYRQFVLRVIDLEALSIEADVPRFLGQFASVLILLSMGRALGLLMSDGAATATPETYLSFVWRGEQSLISATMLVVGLAAVICWDSIFPDRRDLMVLSPLPVAPHTFLLAKVTASASLLGLALLALNFATGIAWPLWMAAHQESNWAFFQSLAAYWLTMVAASIFIFCSVLAVQGIAALLLPRSLFLRSSALLQVAAFGLFLGTYFLQPSITTHAAITAPANYLLLACSPSFWFFAMLNQLNSSLSSDLAWLARRAWIGVAIVVSAATASLLLCYLRTMKTTVEQPDLVPGNRGSHWGPRFGTPLETAIVLFSFRSLTRSRQHRLVFALYLALIVLIAIPWLVKGLSNSAPHALNAEFLISTFMMMSLAAFGMRSVFLRPISLPANWVLRMTQLHPSEEYIAATRRALLFLAVVPVWLTSALLSLSFRPWHHVVTHLGVLLLIGWLFVELGLIGFYKVPFTCSYLPGKLHVQIVFLYYLLLLFVFALLSAEYELPSLNYPFRSVVMISAVAAAALALWRFNCRQAKSAVVSFEELPAKVILTLGLTGDRA